MRRGFTAHLGLRVSTGKIHCQTVSSNLMKDFRSLLYDELQFIKGPHKESGIIREKKNKQRKRKRKSRFVQRSSLTLWKYVYSSCGRAVDKNINIALMSARKTRTFTRNIYWLSCWKTKLCHLYFLFCSQIAPIRCIMLLRQF